jgi:hypothetical protein
MQGVERALKLSAFGEDWRSSAHSQNNAIAPTKRPFPLPRKLFDTMIRRGTSLFQFYCNVAVLYLDLCAWMMALNYFTLPCGLVIGLRLFDEALVLPNYVFFTPSRNHFTTRGL